MDYRIHKIAELVKNLNFAKDGYISDEIKEYLG
jgi:hypothetical protein